MFWLATSNKPNVSKELCHLQTSANNSTEYRYSKITWYSAFIWGQIVGLIGVNDLTQAIFEYLWNGQITASIFASRSSSLTLNHKFYDLTTIQVKHQSFDIRLKDEPQVGTLICRNMVSYNFFVSFSFETESIESLIYFYSTFLRT